MTLRGFRAGKSNEKLHGLEQPSPSSKSLLGTRGEVKQQQALDLSKYRTMIDIIATTPQWVFPFTSNFIWRPENN